MSSETRACSVKPTCVLPCSPTYRCHTCFLDWLSNPANILGVFLNREQNPKGVHKGRQGGYWMGGVPVQEKWQLPHSVHGVWSNTLCSSSLLGNPCILYVPVTLLPYTTVLYSFILPSTPIHTGSWRPFSCHACQVWQVTSLSVGLLIKRDTTRERNIVVWAFPHSSFFYIPWVDLCPVSIKWPSVSKSSDLDLIAQY